MKVHMPGTDLEIDFSVYCDEYRCDEYNLASPTEHHMLAHRAANISEGNVKACFVPIEEGTHIVVAGFLSGHLLHARFDLLADGSWVGDRLVEAGKDGRGKTHHKRRIEFRNVNAVQKQPSPKDPTVQRPPKVIDGELCAKSLPDDVDDRLLSNNGTSFGVGSIALIVSMESEITRGYSVDRADYADMTLGSWSDRIANVSATGVKPTHQLALQNVEERVIKQKSNKFVRHFEQIRFGDKPWAKLIFYYRSKAAILEAGCVPLPSNPLPLKPDSDEVDPMKSPLASTSSHDGNDRDDGLFMTPPPEDEHDRLHETHIRHQKRLGGTLTMPQTNSAAMPPPSTPSFDRLLASYQEMTRLQRLRELEKLKWRGGRSKQMSMSLEDAAAQMDMRAMRERTDSSAKDRETGVEEACPGPEPAANDHAHTYQTLRMLSSADYQSGIHGEIRPSNDELSHTRAFHTTSLDMLGGESIQHPESADVSMLQEAKARYGVAHISSFGPSSEPTATSKAVTAENVVDDLPDLEEICRVIPDDSISVNDLLKRIFPLLQPQSKSRAAKILGQHIQEVAVFRKDESNRKFCVRRDALADVYQQSHTSRPPTLAKSTSAARETKDMVDHELARPQTKALADADTSHEPRSSKSTSSSRSTSLPGSAEDPTSSGNPASKRSASPLTSSREEVPTKRRRLADLAAQKIRLQKEVEAKKARAAAAEKAFEEERRQREEQELRWEEEDRIKEQSMLAEIEELQRVKDEQDADYERFERITRDAETEINPGRNSRESNDDAASTNSDQSELSRQSPG